jgi:hypothetical protein
MKNSTPHRYIWNKIKNNPFPSTVILVFILLTTLGISGSSMGAYDQVFLGKSPGVILGTPRPIRSDEWLVNTQETLAQKAAGYPVINKNIGLGQDMTMIVDAPFNGFFSVFKPENLFFFIMPYANAFAAHWWFMSLVLVLGFYYLFDALFPNKRVIISLAALLVLFNPFVQWWYEAGTLLSIGYALWLCLMFIKIFQNKIDYKKLVLYGLGLAYFALCFAFVLYPPFQLSIAYVIVALMIGFLYYRYYVLHIKLGQDLKRWIAILLSALATILVASIFFMAHKQVINTIVGTAYPGARSIQSGQNGAILNGEGVNMIDTFSSPILFNLQNESRDGLFYTNQSEASRIVAINLLLIPVFIIYVLKKPRKNRQLADYLLLSTSAMAGIFMIRMFTPFFNLPFKILLFNEVQNDRLAIGFVLLCAVQLVLFGVVNVKRVSYSVAAVYAVLVFALFFDASLIMVHQYPKFISVESALLACLAIGLSAFLLLQKKYFIVGLSLFTAFSVASSILVNPLYHRSEPVALQTASNFIKTHYTNHKSWIVVGSVIIENIPAVAGQHSLSGVQIYPQLSLWKKLDPSGIYNLEYNRYAHEVFTIEPNPNNLEFYNPQPDVLLIDFNCTVARELPNLGYILSSQPIANSSVLKCISLSNEIKFKYVTLDIYKYDSPA